MAQFTRREAQRLGLGLLVFLGTNCSMGRTPGRLVTRAKGPVQLAAIGIEAVETS